MSLSTRLMKIREIFDAAHNGIVIIDQNGKIIIFNKGASMITNKQSEETVGEDFSDIFPDFWPDLKAIFDTGKSQIGKKIAIEDSFVIANRSPIFSGNCVIGIISIFQDISEYEKISKELDSYKILNEELNTIIDSSFDGLWICDNEGRVVRINPASEKIGGVEAEQVIGKKMVDLVQEGLVDRSVTLEVLKNKTTVTLTQKQETGKYVLSTGNPVFDQEGNIHLIVVNERDLTELHRLRMELAESRALTQRYSFEITELHEHKHLLSKIVVRSENMLRVFDTAMKVARSDSTVLIQGESGVGKGLLAKMIHQVSNRKDGPFIRVDCGAIPEPLIESELFGYAPGAFTGALSRGKLGLFELADKGTLFLDEVGEIPLSVQVKLFRFLEEKEVIRVGGTDTKIIDTRIIAATNRNIEKMVNQRLFRKELFFRLNVVPLIIPPLRERIEDLSHLVSFFLKKFNQKLSTHKTITSQVLDCLCSYPFPGNIRELENLMERLIILTAKDNIEPEDLPIHISERMDSENPIVFEGEWNLPEAVGRLEKMMIERAVKKFKTQRKAAGPLGIDQSTLARKIKKHRLVLDAKLHNVENLHH